MTLGGADETALQSELARIYEDVIVVHPDTSAVIAFSGAQETNLWRLREDTDLIYRRHPGAPSYDVSIPLSKVESYLERCLIELKAIDAAHDPYVFGHLADGNLHIVLNGAGSDIPAEKVSAIEEAIYRDIGEMGGAFSAEHGIGAKRVASLSALSSPAKLALMHQSKCAFDKSALLNPGKVLSADSP